MVSYAPLLGHERLRTWRPTLLVFNDAGDWWVWCLHEHDAQCYVPCMLKVVQESALVLRGKPTLLVFNDMGVDGWAGTEEVEWQSGMPCCCGTMHAWRRSTKRVLHAAPSSGPSVLPGTARPATWCSARSRSGEARCVLR